MESASVAQAKTFLIIALGLLMSVVIGVVVGSEDYGYLFIGTVALLAICIWCLPGQLFWVLTIASSFLGGTFPILRGQFTPFHVMLMMGVAKFVFEDVILRRRARLQINRIDVLLISGFMLVLLVHGVNDRFGMRFLGSTVWGGRNYVNVLVGLIAFLVVQSMPPDSKFWNKLPYAILAITAFDLTVAIVTSVFPSTIYAIYPFYSAVSVGALEGIPSLYDYTQRIGAFGGFGFALVMVVLARITVQRLFSPGYFFRLMQVGVGTICVLYSGYRSSVINLAVGMFAAGIRDLRRGVIFVLPVVAIVLFVVSFINSEVVRLPQQVQRGLSFIPGQWDAAMMRDAGASVDFRVRTWTLWWDEYFPRQPILGRGFGFKSDWTKTSIYNPLAIDYQQIVETGNIHNGFLSTLDAIGILGTIFFILWCLRLLFLSLRVSYQRDDPAGFAIRFIALYLVVTLVGYWGGAYNLGNVLPQLFPLAGIFLRLLRQSKQEEAGREEPATVRPLPARRQLIPAAAR